MSLDQLPSALVCGLAAYACFLAPGQGWIRRGDSQAPLLFARVLASVVVTTLVATAAAACERFSLEAVLAVNALIAVAGVACRLAAGPAAAPADAVRDRVGPLVFALALAAYWPAYPAFLGASDATAYTATGVSLAHHGTLARDDQLGSGVPMEIKSIVFDSMSQVLGSGGPPFRRTPGAMMLETLESTRAWPDFFPVPSVWAAMFVAARTPAGGVPEEAAPGFAPVFAALALWAFWLIASSWAGPALAAFATLLLGASGPFYSAARTPLSEPIAALFVLGGLAVLVRSSRNMSRADAVLAGAALGAAVFTRVEIALLLVLGFALLPAIASVGRARRGAATEVEEDPTWPPPTFFAALVAVSLLLPAEALLIPGSYVTPLLHHLENARIRTIILARNTPLATEVAVVAGALGALALCLWRFGAGACARFAVVAGVLIAHAAGSSFLAERTPTWLSVYVGWPSLALAAAGLLLAAVASRRPARAAVVAALAVATVLVLFYNPHVYPALPWGARRFVPLLLPLIVLMATYAAARVAARSRIAALVCLAVLAWCFARGGRPSWGKDLMAGSWEQLAQISAAIPNDGVLLVDRGISASMTAPALWLIHDRNSITAPSSDSPAGREILPMLVAHYAPTGPVYLLSRGVGDQTRTPNVRFELVARATLAVSIMEGTYDRLPERLQRYLLPLAVYRLEASPDPLGDPVPTSAIVRPGLPNKRSRVR